MAKSNKKTTSKKAVKPTGKKPAAKKTAAKKPTPKKVVVKSKSKTVVKSKQKPATKKPAKPTVKKAAPKKVVAKKVVAKKPAPKPAVKKVAVVKTISKVSTPVKVKPKPARKVVEDNRTRYSDAELKEFKELIVEKLDAAKSEVKYLNDQINRKDDNGTDDTENKFATMEDGSATMEREYLTQMSVRQAQYIDHLEKALIRIENKTYGICRVTGKLIEKDRLRAVPHATLSMEAKMLQASKN